MAAGTILVVCTANICRSPVAAALLGERLRPDLATVGSAGTHALLDHPAAEETRAFVSRELGRDVMHRAAQLTNDRARTAHLVVTMTAEQRAWVAREAPQVVRRTFTLLELERITRLLTEDRVADVRAFAEECARLRTRAGETDEPSDIPDPYGGPAAGYEKAFRQIAASSRAITSALNARLAPR